MPSTFSLEGKNAVVTGLSTGIGRAIAEALAREGANVAGDYQKDAEAAAITRGLIEAQGREALIMQGSTADEAHIDDMADQVVERWGSLDIWVNNAARIFVKPFLQLETEEWHGLLAANLHGYMFGCRAAARKMAAAGRTGPHHQHHQPVRHPGHQRLQRLHHGQGRHQRPDPCPGAGAGRPTTSPSTRSRRAPPIRP